MLALVKMPHTDIVIHGAHAADIYELIKARFPVAELVESSAPVNPVDEDDEELVELTRSEWWEQNRFRVLRGYRRKHDMSQEELARKSGIARSVIALYENGKRRITPRAAEKLGLALGEDPGKFLVEKLGRASGEKPETLPVAK